MRQFGLPQNKGTGNRSATTKTAPPCCVTCSHSATLLLADADTVLFECPVSRYCTQACLSPTQETVLKPHRAANMMLLAATRYDHATTHMSYCCFMQRLVSGGNAGATPWMAAQTSAQTHTQLNRALLDQHRLSNQGMLTGGKPPTLLSLWQCFRSTAFAQVPTAPAGLCWRIQFDTSSCLPETSSNSHKQLPQYAGDKAMFMPWCSLHFHPNQPATTQAATPQPNYYKSSQHCCSCSVHLLLSLSGVHHSTPCATKLLCISPLTTQRHAAWIASSSTTNLHTLPN